MTCFIASGLYKKCFSQMENAIGKLTVLIVIKDPSPFWIKDSHGGGQVAFERGD